MFTTLICYITHWFFLEEALSEAQKFSLRAVFLILSLHRMCLVF